MGIHNKIINTKGFLTQYGFALGYEEIYPKKPSKSSEESYIRLFKDSNVWAIKGFVNGESIYRTVEVDSNSFKTAFSIWKSYVKQIKKEERSY